jgi:hypothetical protein
MDGNSTSPKSVFELSYPIANCNSVIVLKSVANGKYITSTPKIVILQPVYNSPSFIATLTDLKNSGFTEDQKFQISNKFNSQFSFRSLTSNTFLTRCNGCFNTLGLNIPNFLTAHATDDVATGYADNFVITRA